LTEFSAIFRLHPPEYKIGSIDQRPSFYTNHVSARVGELYSKKDFIVESANQSTTVGGIT
jgi:hypothetical protein